MVKEKIKVILDTDNGDDIDDLITLYFALASEEIELLGVVCSYLNAPLRVKQIKHALKLFNREDIPVYIGASKPLATLHPCPIDHIYCQYTNVLGNETNNDGDGYDEGINFLIDSAKKYGKDLTILEVAPETSLAMAIEKDKEAFKNTSIVLMAGAFYKHENEWNIECDYEAASIVINSGLNLTYVGLDVTDLTILENPYYENMLLKTYNDERIDYLTNCANLWVNSQKRHIVLHDPLTLLTLIHKDLCVFNDEYVALIPSVNKDRYYTTITNNKSDNKIKVAKTLNTDKLFEIYETYMRRLINHE